MTLKDIGTYKNRLLTTIIKSDDICELILGKNYDKTDVDEKLTYKNIFPYLYVDDTQTTADTYICFEVSVPRAQDFTYKNMKIDVWCYCHKDIMKYSKKGYLGTRADILGDMIDRLLNSSDKYGLGRLKLESSMPLNVSKVHYGRHMSYSCVEFNIEKKM